MKPKILFFARSFLAKYYAEIKSVRFESLYVVLTHEEKILLESKGFHVYGCFEDEYDKLNITPVSGDYLRTSFASDRFLQRFNLEKRLEILGKEITFWRNILEKLKPDYLFNETVALEIAEVMAIEAERLNIPFYSSLLGFLPYTFYWKPSPFDGRLNELIQIEPDKEHMLKAKEYFKSVTEKNLKPFYVLDSLKPYNYSLKSLFGSLYRDTKLFLKKKKIQRLPQFKYEDDYTFNPYQNTCRVFNNLLFNYNQLSDIKNNFNIFYPLHVEPEATLNYFAEYYQNQVSTVESIARTLKPYQYLVVKEHPQQKGVLLDKRFRELKKKMPNLIYLPAEINSQEVIKKSEAIVTLTSTAAWEGVIFGKPVFVLGKIFYDQCPGVKRIENISHFKKEIRKEEYLYPVKEEVILFIARMISIFYKGCPTPEAIEDFNQNIADYTRAIEAQIK